MAADLHLCGMADLMMRSRLRTRRRWRRQPKKEEEDVANDWWWTTRVR